MEIDSEILELADKFGLDEHISIGIQKLIHLERHKAYKQAESYLEDDVRQAPDIKHYIDQTMRLVSGKADVFLEMSNKIEIEEISKHKIVYVDGVDFSSHLGGAADSKGAVVYNSLDDLKKGEKCWEECGVIEAKLSFIRYIVNPVDHLS